MTTTQITDLGAILGVWAHPDDETYLSAAIMAEAVDRGQRVACVTATRGEAGSLDHERWPPEKMGEIRERELAASLEILGVTEHHWLDYIDGRCDQVDDDEATAKIADVIAQVDPDSILTFGPDGQTGHPDHIAVHRWTTAAFRKAAKPGARLFHAITEREWFDEFGKTLEENNVYAPGTPRIVSREEVDIYLDAKGARLDQKLDAIQAQVSQVEWLIAAVGYDFYRRGLALESFQVAGVR
jgi:LmbE family N-acetylglucosaminyl deacetylase